MGKSFFHSFEGEYMSSLISSDRIKARHFHTTKHFIDDLCIMNYSGEFGRSICEIHSKDFKLKVEHQGDHSMCFNLDITIEKEAFVYKLFEKGDNSPFQL